MTPVWDELQELLQKLIQEKDVPQQKFATEALVYGIEETVDEHTTDLVELTNDLVELRNRIIKLEQNSSNISPVWEQLIKDLASRIRKLELTEKPNFTNTLTGEIEILLDQMHNSCESQLPLSSPLRVTICAKCNRIRDILFALTHRGDEK